MFRALADQLRFGEGFQDHSEFIKQQTAKYTKQLQNPYLTVLPPDETGPNARLLATASQAFQSVDPNTRRANMRDLDIQNYAYSMDLNQEILKQVNACRTANLDTLRGSQNERDKLRCGWIYQKGTPTDQPKVSTGYLGTASGPTQAAGIPPAGRWFWNLDDAKKEILKDRCNALTTCKNVGAENYKECAWSSERGIGVPVDRNGQLLYPNDAALRGGGLVSSAGGCPPPPPVGSPAYELARSRDVCTPLPDGRLSRDCLLQQVTAAGCKMDGTLYRSLVNEAQPNNYFAGLEKRTPFTRYQQDAANPLMAAAMKDGKVTTAIALTNFQQLAKEAADTKETAINYASRDLCFKMGDMDQYDFCTDLLDASPSPFALDCLQKEFRKQGGQPAGSEYPRQGTLAKWNSFRTWGAVKAAIKSLGDATRSSDINVQRDALKQFLGITRESPSLKQIGRMPGLDVFWINSATNTFVGRRTPTSAAKLPSLDIVAGEVEKTGLADFVEYIVLTNVRPPSDMSVKLRMETDDGTVWVLNKDLNPKPLRGFAVDTSDTFGRNWDQPPTTHTQGSCWSLKGGGANYMLGTWQETGGYAHSKTFFSECSSGNFRELPSEWLTLTQEPEAPMFAWEGMMDEKTGVTSFREYRLPTLFSINPTGAYSIKESSAIPGVPAVLQLTGGAFAQTSRNFAANSWRTLTAAVSVSSLPSARTALLSFGNLFVDIVPTGSTFSLVFRWVSATLNMGQSGVSVEGLPLNTPILMYVNMRSDFEGRFPNRVTFAAAPIQAFAAGNVNLSLTNASMKSVTTTGNAPLFNKTDSATLSIGNTSAPPGLNMSVGWIHLFDYELDAGDVARDAKNAWIRVPLN